jgi:tryptophan synthase alpha chain
MLEALFQRSKDAFRSAFIPYVMAGDPDLETTQAILAELTAAGADAIELGIPYGDPLADGPTIAAAANRALERGVTIEHVFEITRSHKDRGGAPIVLFTYFNPVYQYGIARFARDAGASGASGVIVPDIALEESDELTSALAEQGIDMPLLVAPSTPPSRAHIIAERSTGFIYVVSRLGVTGASSEPSLDALRAQIIVLRGITEKPLAAGFGVSTPEQVAGVARLADGIIVGSAIIDSYQGTAGDEAVNKVRDFVRPLIAATYYRLD